MVFPNSSDTSPLSIQSGDLWKDSVFFAIVFLLFDCIKLGRAGVLRKVMGKTTLGISLLVRLLLACPADHYDHQLNRELLEYQGQVGCMGLSRLMSFSLWLAYHCSVCSSVIGRTSSDFTETWVWPVRFWGQLVLHFSCISVFSAFLHLVVNTSTSSHFVRCA